MSTYYTITAPEAATVTLRMTEQEARRFICDCTAIHDEDECDDWPVPDLELDTQAFEGGEDSAAMLIKLMCGKHLIDNSDLIYEGLFYQRSMIGPILVLFAHGTDMVQIIATRPSEGIYRAVRWMFEGEAA